MEGFIPARNDVVFPGSLIPLRFTFSTYGLFFAVIKLMRLIPAI